jgi:hypothetical protein
MSYDNKVPRYLCSELVALKIGSTTSTVNLEEIWPEGAVLDAENAVENGAHVELRSGDVLLAGRVVQVELHQFGWRVEVVFSPLTPWDLEKFRPQHLLAL